MDIVEAASPGRKIIIKIGHIRLVRNLLEAQGLNEVQVCCVSLYPCVARMVAQTTSVLKALRAFKQKEAKKRWAHVRTRLLQDAVMSEGTIKSIEEHLRYGCIIVSTLST